MFKTTTTKYLLVFQIVCIYYAEGSFFTTQVIQQKSDHATIPSTIVFFTDFYYRGSLFKHCQRKEKQGNQVHCSIRFDIDENFIKVCNYFLCHSWKISKGLFTFKWLHDWHLNEVASNLSRNASVHKCEYLNRD